MYMHLFNTIYRVHALIFCIILLCKLLFIVTITNGPVDTVICSGSFVDIPCGFSGAPANVTFPIWMITRRRYDGSVMSMTIHGRALYSIGSFNGLKWIPDLTTGGNDAPNGVLRVYEVGETYINQSTYRCVFEVANNSDINSTIGALTVAGECAVYVSITVYLINKSKLKFDENMVK